MRDRSVCLASESQIPGYPIGNLIRLYDCSSFLVVVHARADFRRLDQKLFHALQSRPTAVVGTLTLVEGRGSQVWEDVIEPFSGCVDSDLLKHKFWNYGGQVNDSESSWL